MFARSSQANSSASAQQSCRTTRLLTQGRAVLLALLLLTLGACSSAQSLPASTTGGPALSSGAAIDAGRAMLPSSPRTALRTVPWNELPIQAKQTLCLIASRGPFPYPRDGVTFGNYERRLPDQPSGYYHEYTVPTPGSADRGARRVIVGADESFFYTADHYATLVEILR